MFHRSISIWAALTWTLSDTHSSKLRYISLYQRNTADIQCVTEPNAGQIRETYRRKGITLSIDKGRVESWMQRSRYIGGNEALHLGKKLEGTIAESLLAESSDGTFKKLSLGQNTEIKAVTWQFKKDQCREAAEAEQNQTEEGSAEYVYNDCRSPVKRTWRKPQKKPLNTEENNKNHVYQCTIFWKHKWIPENFCFKIRIKPRITVITEVKTKFNSQEKCSEVHMNRCVMLANDLEKRKCNYSLYWYIDSSLGNSSFKWLSRDNTDKSESTTWNKH